MMMYAEQPPFDANGTIKTGEDAMRALHAEAAADMYACARHHAKRAEACEPGSMWRYYWKTRERRALAEFEAHVDVYCRLSPNGEEVGFDYELARELELDPANAE